jgi:hypothetical protein
MADKMVTRLESLGYGEAQSITFHLVKQDKVYEIKDQDSVSQQLGEMLVDQSGISQE